MVGRVRTVVLAVLGIVVLVGVVWSQDRRPRDPPTPETQRRPDPAAERVAELEKQMQALTKEVKTLRDLLEKKAAERPAEKKEVKIFTLKHADADELAKLLIKLFDDPKKPLRIAADPNSNSVIVNTDSETGSVIEAVLERLDVQPAKKKGGNNKGGAEKPAPRKK